MLLSEQVVSESGRQFSADEFATLNGIKHIKCAPYHPSSNYAVEQMVQTFKKAKLANFCSHIELLHMPPPM